MKEEDPRVEMGGSTNKPSFGPLIALASHLVKCQWSPTTTDDCPSFTKKYTKDSDAKPKRLVTMRYNLPAEAIELFTN